MQTMMGKIVMKEFFIVFFCQGGRRPGFFVMAILDVQAVSVEVVVVGDRAWLLLILFLFVVSCFG